MKASEKALTKPSISFKTQTLYMALATVAAVALPQLCHVMGSVSGVGTAIGETFLPMHLPILFIGLFAGPYAGSVAGFISPLISFALTGMPNAVMLPFMMIELCAYGLFAGVLRNVNIPVVLKVLIAQILGRAVRAIAILIAVYAMGNTSVAVASIWKSVATGIFGIALQLILIPLIIYRVENVTENER